MGFPFLKRTTRTIGYDLGASSIKIAVIEAKKDRRVIKKLVALPIQEELVSEGLILDGAGITERLRRTLNVVDLKNAAVVTAARISRESMLRYEDVPRASREKARAALPTDKAINFPLAPGDGVFDLVILDNEGAGPMMKVVAVAARRASIRQRMKVFDDAMIPLAGIDLDAFALYNLFRVCLPDQARNRALLLNVGYETAMITVVRDGAIVLARQTMSSGTRHLLEQIEMAGRFGSEQGEDLLASEELTSLHGDIVENWISNLAMDIRQASDFRDAAQDEDLGDVYVTGGGALVHGVRDELAKALEARVQILNPLEHMGADSEVKANHMHEGPLYAIALGLALRDDL